MAEGSPFEIAVLIRGEQNPRHHCCYWLLWRTQQRTICPVQTNSMLAVPSECLSVHANDPPISLAWCPQGILPIVGAHSISDWVLLGIHHQGIFPVEFCISCFSQSWAQHSSHSLPKGSTSHSSLLWSLPYLSASSLLLLPNLFLSISNVDSHPIFSGSGRICASFIHDSDQELVVALL